MSESTAGLVTSHCIRLRRAANEVSKLYDSYLKQAGVSANQFSLLAALENLGEGSVSDLANYVGLERTTVTRTIRPLLERGLVADVSERGTRSRCLKLTEKGEITRREGSALWMQAEQEMEKRVEDLDLFEKMLRNLKVTS